MVRLYRRRRGVRHVALFIPWSRVVTGQNDFLGQYCGTRLVGTPLVHDAGAEFARAVDGLTRGAGGG